MFTCGILLEHTDPDKDEKGCLLKNGHGDSHSEHLTYLGYSGFNTWETNWNCGCDTDDYCGCAIYDQVTFEEALTMLINSYGAKENFPDEVKAIIQQHKENPARFQKE